MVHIKFDDVPEPRASEPKEHEYDFGAVSRYERTHIIFEDDKSATKAAKDDFGAFLSIARDAQRLTLDTNAPLPHKRSQLPPKPTYPAGKSFLETLPNELMDGVLKYMVDPLITYSATASVRPQNQTEYDKIYQFNFGFQGRTNVNYIIRKHPFLQLALASRAMNSHVERFCNHMCTTMLAKLGNKDTDSLFGKKKKKRDIKQKAKIQGIVGTGGQVVTTPSTSDALPRAARLKWLDIAYKRCLCCGYPTSRRAIFDYMVYCCRKCDSVLWPKVSKMELLTRPKVADHSRFAKGLLREVHLDDTKEVFGAVVSAKYGEEFVGDKCKGAVEAYDWATKKVYVLLEDVDRIVGLVRELDTNGDMGKNTEAVLRQARMVYLGIPKEVIENEPWAKWKMDTSKG